MLTIFIVIGVLVYMAIKKEQGNVSEQIKCSNAIEIAKARLASGEISILEYERIKKNLQ